MNVQNEAKKQGYNDFWNGVSKQGNPYQYTSDIFKQASWLTGWNKAEKEDKQSRIK